MIFKTLYTVFTYLTKNHKSNTIRYNINQLRFMKFYRIGVSIGILTCSCQPHKTDFVVSQSLFLSVSQSAYSPICSTLPRLATKNNVNLNLVFFDDFDELNLNRWSPHYDAGYDNKSHRWLGYDLVSKRTLQGNHEQQIYVDSDYKGSSPKSLGLNPFIIENGILSIVAQKTPPQMKKFLYQYEFISGLLTSRQSFSQLYGYFEIRARIPSGKALWPAFWLLPVDKSWPPELDIIEVVGQQPDLIVSTAHWANAAGEHKYSGCRTKLPDANRDFHLYGALWTARRITYFIDRVAVAEIATPSGMNKPMYLIINLAVGGNMVGYADVNTPLPAKYDIDWVASYRISTKNQSNDQKYL